MSVIHPVIRNYTDTLQPAYQYYNFSNIRYAQPPLGDLRFAAPVAPQGRNEVVQNGSVGSICPQAQASWVPIAYQYATAILTNQTSSFNLTQAEAIVANTPFDKLPNGSPRLNELPPRDPREREDCLFLDVMVPRSVWERAGNKSTKGAPVLIWFVQFPAQGCEVDLIQDVRWRICHWQQIRL